MPGLPDFDSRATSLHTFTVRADGSALGADYQIVSIEIRREVNRVPKASIVLNDGDAASQGFARSEETTLLPGVEIEILGGYSSNESSLFKGIIVRQRIEVGLGGGSRLTIEARDPVFRMTLGRRSRNFSEVTDSEVMEQLIASSAGLSAEVSPTSIQHPQVVQHQVSDWDYLVMLAEANNQQVICHDGKVSVAEPLYAGAAVTSAVFGQSLFSAELEMDAESQLSSVGTAAWDMNSQELLSSEADDAQAPALGDIPASQLAETGGVDSALRHPGQLDQAQLDQWAKARMGRARRAAIRGRLRVQGNPDLLPGVLLDLAGLGSRFNGTGLISGVRHKLGRGDWISEVQIGSDPRGHAERYQVAAPPAGGLRPAVTGLQIGVVKALQGDPAGEDRIQIHLATLDQSDGLLWARQALLDAGDSRGSCFRPELEDEVVVGFLDGDPHFPVILGALHSSAKPAPLTGSDDNHEKAIVTRSGMRIHWDDERIVTTIDTPNGNRIQLSEEDSKLVLEDENQNRIELSADGISLDSARDITLKATGDLKFEGTNIEFSANASFKAEGGAGAELGSGANTVIRGSLVQIN